VGLRLDVWRPRDRDADPRLPHILAAILLYGGEINGTVIAAKKRRLHKLHDQHFEEVVKVSL
jgi:hypothetical protein